MQVQQGINLANVWIGALGGIVPTAVRMIQWANVEKSKRPESPAKDSAFWFLFIFLPIVGGGVVALYECFGTTFNGLLAFQVGVTAPAFLQQLVSATPPLGKTN